MMSNPVYLTSEVVSEQIPLWFCMYAVAFRACVDEREWWRDRIDVCSASFCAQFNQWARHLISFIWCRVVRCLDAVWSWHVYMYLMFSKQEEIKWLLFLMTTESTLVGLVLVIIFGLWTYDFGLMTPKGVDNSNPLQSATMHNTASVRHTHTNSLAHSQCDNNLKGVFAESQNVMYKQRPAFARSLDKCRPRNCRHKPPAIWHPLLTCHRPTSVTGTADGAFYSQTPRSCIATTNVCSNALY